ncbi:hypothetical protein Lser_V15G20718 [Lactuca serriola]
MAATEIDIPDFLSSKKDEREDYGLSSEILEEKIAEFSGNKVKQLEVAESVNTEQMETESETFFQALSVPIVSADEGTTESCKAVTTEDQEERKSTKIEEAKPFHDQSVQIVASKEETEEDKSINSQEDQREQKTEGSVESCSEIKKEEDTEEIKPNVEPDEKKDSITVKTEPQIESDDGIKDTTFEGGLQEKTYHGEGNEAEAVKTKEHIEDDVEETTFQHATTVAYVEEGQTLNAAPKDISKEEEVEDKRIDPQEAIEKCENGAKEEREQEHEESVDKFVQTSSEIEQKEDTEEIKPSVETEEKTEVIPKDCITSQTEPHVISAEHEIKNDEAIQSEETGLQKVEYKEEVKHSDSSLTEIKSESPIVKEASEETVSEKTGYEEGLQLSDSYNIALKENEMASKVEDEEKEQEDKSSDAQEASKECVKEEREQKSEENVNKIVDEETSSEKVEYEEEVKHSDSSNVEINEKTLPILSKDEDLERKQEGNTLEKDQGDDTVTSSHDATYEGGLKEREHHSEVNEPEVVKTKESIGEDTEEIRTSEETILEKVEFEEGLQFYDSSNIALNENEIAYEEKEQEVYVSGKGQGDGDDVTSPQDATCEDIKETTIDEHASTEVAYLEEAQSLSPMPEEILKEEAEDKPSDAQEASEKCDNEAEDKSEQQPEEIVNKSVKSSSETEQGEDTEDIKPSVETEQQASEQYESGANEKIEQKPEEIVNKIEDTKEIKPSVEIDEKEQVKITDYEEDVIEVCEETHLEKGKFEGVEPSDNDKDQEKEKEQESIISEEDQGKDDITCSQDATSIEVLPVFVKPKENIEEDTQEIKSSADTKDDIKIDEEALVNDDDQTKKSESPLVKEVCEVTSSEKAESELNENEIVSKEENQEKEQELKMSEEVQGGGYDVTSSQNASNEDIKEAIIGQQANPVANIEFEEQNQSVIDAQEDKKEQKSEESDNKIVQSGSEIEQEKDTEETKPSVEVFEEASSEKIEYKEEVNYSDSSNTETMVKEVCEESVSEKVESEEGLKLSDSVNIDLNENEIASKVEDEEKEQEVYVSGKGLGDDVTSSQDATFEDIKETTTGEHVTTVAYLEEEQALNSTPKEILKEEAEDKSTDVQEASEQDESGANEKIEQKPEESVNKNENAEEIKPSVETDEKEQVKITDDEDVIEVCEETHLEKGKFEGVEPSDKDEHQEKEKEQEQEQESIISEEDQGKDDVTFSQDATSIQDLPETKYDDEGKEPEFVKPREYLEEDTEEIKSSAETKDDIKIDEEALVNDDGQTDKSESPLVKEVCEATSSEKAESELNENEIVNNEENQEKEQEIKMSKEVQGGGDDVTSSQNASSEDIKETIIGQKATPVADIEFEEPNQSAIDAQEDKTEQKPDESDNKTVQCCSEIEQEEDTKESKPSVETKQQELLHDNCITSQTKSQVESEEHEVKSDEPIQSDNGQKENVDSSPVNEVCEETSSEKVEYSEEVKETTNEKEIVNKVEDEEKEQEVYVSGKGLGDDVTTKSSKDATCEDIKETTVGQHDTTVAYLEEGQAIGLMPKEILMEETEEKPSDAQEVACISAQTESQEETTETEQKNEESIKEVYEETTKEVCDETSSKKVESEQEVKAIETFKDEEQEKDQVDMSTEGQGEDNVTSSQVAALEEDLQEKNYQEEGKEPEVVETRESVEENIEEIESSIETKENMEQQGLLHVITTDVCSSTEIEPKKETMENEEKIEEDAIVNDEFESPLVKEVCEVTGSEKAEPELNENEIVSKEENQEKEHELKMPEEVQGGGDAVTSSEDATCEDIQESTIGQHVTTVVDFEESKDDSALTKEILKEEIEDKSIHAQEASEQYDDNGAKDKIEESASIIFEQEMYTEEIKPSVETDEKEQQEVCEETDLKKTVSEEGINSDMYQNEKEIEILSKDEYQEKEQELNIPEKDQSEDEVICSQDTVAASEDVFFETRESMEEDNELISTNVKTKEKVEQGELPHAITTDVFTSAQVESQEEKTETEEKNKEPIEHDDGQMETPPIHSVKEVCDETSSEKVESEEGITAIETFKDEDQEKDQVNMSAEGQGEDNVTTSQVAALEEDLQKKNYQEEGKEPEFFETRESIEEDTEEIKSSVETIEKKEDVVNDDGQTEKSESSLVKEVHEVTGLEKVESELNEDETVSKEENQAKEKDLKMSEEVQDGEDDVTSSQNASSEDIKETTIGQHATTVVNTDERQEQTEMTKEIFLEDLETVSEVQIPGVGLESEDSNMKEECLTTATHVDEEKETETKEVSSAETTEIGENKSLYEKEDVTQENQLNSTEDCSEISKDVILTKEIEQVPLETQKEKGTDDLEEQIVEEYSNSTELQEKSTEDQKAPVILYSDPSEIDESPKHALESVCDVQTPEVVADSEDSKVKEESIVSATTEYTDENNGEKEHEVIANETSSTENLELHGELKPMSEMVIEEYQVKETKPQPEQSDITAENIMENVILPEKDLADEKTTSDEKELTDEVSSELGQPKGQIVEEIQAGPTEIISETIEEEITKKDEYLSHDSIQNPNDTTTKEEKCFQDAITREIEPVAQQNDGLDEVSNEKSTDSNETTEVEPQEDIVPSSSLVTLTEETPKTLPLDLESVYDVKIPELVPKSEDSNPKEDRLTSATTTYVDEEKQTVTKEISSDEKTEQTTKIGADDSLYEKEDMKEDVTQENQLNSTEDCSEMSKDVILNEEVPLNIPKEKETDDLKEQIVEEDSHSTELQEKSSEDQKETAHVIPYSDPIPVGVSEVRTDEISSEETTESKQVAEHLSISSRDAVFIKEDLEVIKPTSESVIEEDEVKETNPEPKKSDITSENIIKYTSEKDLADEKRDIKEDVTLAPENQIDNTKNQSETIKNIILTDEVVVETEKEEEKNEVNEHVSEEDICPPELDKTSTSNQKDLDDEIEYSKPIPAGNNEVKEVKAESPTELENIQSAEAPDLEFEKKEKDDELISEIQTPETTLKMEMEEEHPEVTNDTCQTPVDGSLSEKKLVSIVPLEELASSTVEDQTKELVLETDKTQVDHSNISNKDRNLEFTEEEFPKILVTEEKTLEEDANKEKETLSESQADDLTKTTSDSISSPTEQGIEVRSEESISRGYDDIHKSEEKPTEVFEIASDVAEIVPEGSKVSESLPGNVQEASPMMLLEKNNPETTTTIEKITPEVAVIDVQKREKDFDYTPEAITVDAVNNAECSDIQSVQKKEVDENIEREIPTEKEPLELDAPVTPGTTTTEDLEISQKHVTDDLIKISKIQPEIQTYEGSACTVDNQSSNKPHLDESIERKLLTGNKDVANELGEPTTKPLIAEADDLKATKSSGTESQCSSEAFGEEKKMGNEKEKSQTAVAENLIEERETALTKDQQVDKEETGEKGTKTDEENEEEDEDDNQMIDAPVMVEASKDIEVKTPKKSHNILSGVGSKVKHSIAKVKKAITGKSSPSKPPSPKEKDQVST